MGLKTMLVLCEFFLTCIGMGPRTLTCVCVCVPACVQSGSDDCRLFKEIEQRHPKKFDTEAIAASCLIFIIFWAVGTG